MALFSIAPVGPDPAITGAALPAMIRRGALPVSPPPRRVHVPAPENPFGPSSPPRVRAVRTPQPGDLSRAAAALRAERAAQAQTQARNRSGQFARPKRPAAPEELTRTAGLSR
jgi:hypothetical protein